MNAADGNRQSTVAAARYTLIDGLRGLAAFAVLIFHYKHFYMSGPDRTLPAGFGSAQPAYGLFAPIYDFGFYAVQLFWIISGFVFALVYYGNRASTREFAINRIARLYPLHFLTLLIVAALQWVSLSRFGHTMLYGNFDLKHFFLQLFMASDWVGGGSFSFNGPIWSVSVEVLIYATFWMSRRAVERFGLPVLLCLMLLCLPFRQHELIGRVFNCGFYFYGGCIVATLWRFLPNRFPMLAGTIVSFAFAGTLGLKDGGVYAREVFGIPGIAGATILALAAAERFASPKVQAACAWLGDNTYGIYLWHVPIQLIVLLVLKPIIDPADVVSSGWFAIAFLVSTVAAGRLSFVYFERPMREWLRRWQRGPAVVHFGGDIAPRIT